MKDCSCPIFVAARWKKMLPDMVKAAVATFDFRTETQRALKTADEVWQSLQDAGIRIAVVTSTNHATGKSDTDASNGSGATAGGDVAAMTSGGGRGRGGRGRSGRRGRSQMEKPRRGPVQGTW